MTELPDPGSLLPLSEPVFQILLSLDAEELHGYAILQDVEERTEGDLVLSTSTLYGALQRMRRDGLVERSERRPEPEEDDRRRYWRITEFGRQVAAAEAERVRRLARMIDGRCFEERPS